MFVNGEWLLHRQGSTQGERLRYAYHKRCRARVFNANLTGYLARVPRRGPRTKETLAEAARALRGHFAHAAHKYFAPAAPGMLSARRAKVLNASRAGVLSARSARGIKRTPRQVCLAHVVQE